MATKKQAVKKPAKKVAPKKVKTIEVPFSADEQDDMNHTMSLKGLKPLKIRYGIKSRTIVVICEI